MAPRWPSSRSAPTRTSECQRGRGRARARARAGMMCDVVALCSDWYDISDVDGESRQRSLLLVLRARARPTCTMHRLQHSRHDAPWCVCAHLHAGRLCSRSGWTELRALRSRPFRGRCWSAHLCFPVRELRHCGRMLHQSTQHVEAGASPRSQVHAWAGAALQGRSGSRAQDYLANCPAHNRIWGTWCARARPARPEAVVRCASDVVSTGLNLQNCPGGAHCAGSSAMCVEVGRAAAAGAGRSDSGQAAHACAHSRLRVHCSGNQSERSSHVPQRRSAFRVGIAACTCARASCNGGGADFAR